LVNNFTSGILFIAKRKVLKWIDKTFLKWRSLNPSRLSIFSKKFP
jgi:hypothetical protein